MNSHYYNIGIKVTVGGKLTFNVVKSISIENTTEKFSDTAKIELPREFKNATQDNNGLSLAKKNILDFIKVGDTIKIEAGYNGNLQTEFNGYITVIGAEIPLLLECEDEMYKLKKMAIINKTYSNIKLKALLADIVKGYEIEALDMDLGKFMIDKATPYKVVEELKQQYGIRCYFRGKTLVAGLVVDLKPQKNHDFTFGKNIRKSSDLKYLTKEARKVWIKAESMQKGGKTKKPTFEYGDQGESEITLHAPLNLTQKELEAFTKKAYNSRTFEGYSGSIDGWALPKTQAGDVANLTDPNYSNKCRDGRFFIESVTTTINESEGFKRQNKLSFKINSNEKSN
jgi:hypothetical protein